MFRDVGNIAMDLNGVEHIQFNALGGADTITVNDLTGTDVKQVAIDLSGTPGSGQGDGAADTVIVNGTAGDDTHHRRQQRRDRWSSTDWRRQVTIAGAEGATDSLVVNGGGGNDTINASALNAGQVNLTINGGDGDDTIIGSAGNDTVIGGRGNDVALLGAGDDTFVWNPGDGSDTVDGQAGNDTLVFNGANINEKIDISANGGHARLSPATSPTSRWTSTTSRPSTSTPWAARTPSRSTTCPGPTSSKVNIDLGSERRRRRPARHHRHQCDQRRRRHHDHRTTTAWSRCRGWPPT